MATPTSPSASPLTKLMKQLDALKLARETARQAREELDLKKAEQLQKIGDEFADLKRQLEITQNRILENVSDIYLAKSLEFLEVDSELADKIRNIEQVSGFDLQNLPASGPIPSTTIDVSVDFKSVRLALGQLKASCTTENSPTTTFQAVLPPTFPNVSIDNCKNALRKEKKKGQKAKLTKDDIGTPTDFRHVGHLGWDPDKGWDTDNLDPDIKALFDKAGVSENELKNKHTAAFIYDFIEQHGGLEAIKKERQRPPPLIASSLSDF